MLLSEMKFDLVVAKASLVLDIMSHVLVTVATDTSEGLFVGFMILSSFGAGMVPAMQSVAMCMLHLADGPSEEQTAKNGGAEVGKLFGAFAVLEPAGIMIIGVRALFLSDGESRMTDLV